jgi:signal transduction histidine kinase
LKPLDNLRDSLGELIKIETHLTSMRRKLDQAIDWQRRFEADAAHELRTPVAGLRLQLEAAQQHPDEIDVEQVLDRALQEVDRLQEIVDDLHLLAQTRAAGKTVAPAPVDLAQLVQAEVSRRADGHRIEVHAPEGVVVNAVAPKLFRLLTELLDNAQRHARHVVEVHVRKAGDQAELIVADDGDGIAEADRQRVFQQFVRLDAARSRDRGGTGLGLSIVHNIATAHAGTVHVEDSSTGGARFVVRLPLAP